DAKVCGHAFGSTFERDLEIVTKIGAALCCRPARATASAAKHIATTKQVSKDVFDAAKSRRAQRTSAGAARHSRMTEPVVTLPLFGTRQHTVSLGGFLKTLFRSLVVRIFIRVVLDCETPVGRLQLLLRGRTVHAKHFIIV